QGGQAVKRFGQSRVRFAGADEANIELGKAARLACQCRRERTAATHLVANVGEDGAGAGAVRVVDDKAQSAVEILPCRQHDGEFGGDLAKGPFVNTAGTAELALEQFAETPAAIGR